MTFLYPLGLLGLIGIPILIIIYLIKSKYTEQTVASTYLWTLSERFLKRKPISKLTGIISLILQMLIVAATSLAIAHPVIDLPGDAHRYCFVLDASGSMNMKEGEKTRFDLGKEEIAKIIDGSVDGSLYSLVYVSDSTSVVYEEFGNKERAIEILNDLEPTYGAGEMSDALGVAQKYFNNDKATLNYLVTDKSYQGKENVNLINVAKVFNNCTVKDISYAISGTEIVVSGTAISHYDSVSRMVELFVDDSTDPIARTMVVLMENTETKFSISCPIVGFSQLRVAFAQADILAEDNEAMLFNPKSEKSYRTLIVGDATYMIQMLVESALSLKVDTMTTKEYDKGENISGYGLYIFDSYTPAELPTSAAVWFINPRGSVEDSGFTVGSEFFVSSQEKAPLTISTSTSTAVAQLKEGVIGDDIYISQYVNCGIPKNNFTQLYTFNGAPVIFAGMNDFGNREVVIAFNLHDSTLPLLPDFGALVNNFIEYSFPDVIETTSYNVGDEIIINSVVGCELMTVTTPDGKTQHLDFETGITTFIPDDVGVHTVVVKIGEENREFKFFAAMLDNECRSTSETEETFSVAGTPEESTLSGKFDTLWIMFIAIAVLFLAEWGVYCYDKYQLR